MSLALRLAVLIALVVLSAVVITAALNFAKFAQVTDRLDESRYAFLAADLRATLEASLDLGLPLEQVENAQDIIDRQRHRDPEILSIEVFDAAGTVLYSSARARPDLMAALNEATFVSVPLNGDLIAATRLVNPFGATVGGVAIRVSAASAAARDQTMLASLGTAVLTAAAIGTAAVAVVAMLLLAGVQRRLQIQRRIIASLSGADEPRTAAAPATAFEHVAAEALGELRDVERLVQQSRDRAGPT